MYTMLLCTYMVPTRCFLYLFAFAHVFLANTDCCDYHDTIWNNTVKDMEKLFANSYARPSTKVPTKNDAVSKFNIYWQKLHQLSISTPKSIESASNSSGWLHPDQMATPTKYDFSQKQNHIPNSGLLDQDQIATSTKHDLSQKQKQKPNYGWLHQDQKMAKHTKDDVSQKKNYQDQTMATPTKDDFLLKQNQISNSTENVNDTTTVTKPTTGYYDHAKERVAKVNASTTTRKLFNKHKNGFRVIESPQGDIMSGGELRHGDMPHHVYLYKMVLAYRAFCGGSIITITRVLTSTNCLLTNKKNVRPGLKSGLRSVHVVAGTLQTHIEYVNRTYQQWRKIRKLYSQEFYRHPQYSLTILVVDRRWIFNDIVNRIPFASRDYDFDGVCDAVAVKTSKSWAKFKQLHLAEVKMITRGDCESIFLRNTRVFYCTGYDYDFLLYSLIPGGGLICQKTGDPLEVNEKQGILVAVTVQNQYHMPTLHQKVGMFYQWVVDTAHVCYLSWEMLAAVLLVLIYF